MTLEEANSLYSDFLKRHRASAEQAETYLSFCEELHRLDALELFRRGLGEFIVCDFKVNGRSSDLLMYSYRNLEWNGTKTDDDLFCIKIEAHVLGEPKMVCLTTDMKVAALFCQRMLLRRDP